MSRNQLVAAIAAAVLAVAALAVLTPTVIVKGESSLRLQVAVPVPVGPPGSTPYAPAPYGQRRQFGAPLPGLRACLEKAGLGRRDRNAPSDLKTMRDALKACARQLPGMPFRRLP